ncbi:MAG: NAD(P)/FAD-dependent oxidoreductase [Candidatus Omnitrophica bacterium]|nr:NAD(P)/FAD-dependent oxidoreductase [Candidatus Omnitrophota bacterium]
MNKNLENSLIRIDEILLALDEKESLLGDKISKILGINEKEILRYSLVRRAVDSRKKENISFVYSVDVEIKNPQNYLSRQKRLSSTLRKKALRHKVRWHKPYDYKIKKVALDGSSRPIVVGAGPSGLFCALVLAQAGLKPLVVERGADVDVRVKDVSTFFSKGKLDLNSNVQFGEGGAGTFSDGKLYTNIKDSRTKYIFDHLVEAGAPKRIAIDAHPYIGTDKLCIVVKNLRKKIMELGGEVKFNTCFTDVEVDNKKVAAIILNKQEKVLVDHLVVAIGHSARDTYQMLYEKNLAMKAKSFSVGLRIEHPAELINKSQYGKYYNHPKLQTARYKLVAHLEGKRSVYTFCMCPGGSVVAASSEKGMVVVNGMSAYAQSGKNSNSALMVNVTPEDFGSDHPLAGIEFQRTWERAAFILGGKDYCAPAQLVGDFLKGLPSEEIGSVDSTYKPGVVMTSLTGCLPDYVIESIKLALPILDRKIKGFAQEDALLVGVETRSSAPVRFMRNESLQSNIAGIYPAGEGSGYAGGIVSSAVDGIKAAESIIGKFCTRN